MTDHSLKALGFVLTLIVIVTVVWVIRVPPSKLSIDNEVTSIHETAETGTEIKNQDLSEPKTESVPPSAQTSYRPSTRIEITEETESKAQLILDELNQNHYHKNPLIELFSAVSEYEHCKSNRSKLKKYQNQIEKIEQMILELENQCEFIEETYPKLLNSKNDMNIGYLMFNEKFDSELSLLFRRIESNERGQEISDEIVTQFLDSQSPHMIRILSKVPGKYNLNLIADSLAIQVNSSNKKYLDMIIDHTLEVRACELMECKSSSEFMLKKCKADHLLCGQDMDFWLKHYITPGHYQDIQAGLSVLASIAPEERDQTP